MLVLEFFLELLELLHVHWIINVLTADPEMLVTLVAGVLDTPLLPAPVSSVSSLVDIVRVKTLQAKAGFPRDLFSHLVAHGDEPWTSCGPGGDVSRVELPRVSICFELLTNATIIVSPRRIEEAWQKVVQADR